MTRVAVLFDNSVRPETTGLYVRRALGRLGEVEHFLPREFERLARGDHGRFDLYLAVDDGLEYRLPESLRPLAFWAIDTHVSFDQILAKSSVCDHVFAAQRDGAARLRRAGIDSAAWLPLACDPDIHRPHPVPKRYDVGFVGHVFPGPREALLRRIQERFPGSFVGRRYLHAMAETYSASRVVFNRSIADDVNMRVFEALSCGSLLLTNALDENGQNELFRDGEHLAVYTDADDPLERIAWHLKHEHARERIASDGRREAIARHTYRHRVEAILKGVEQGQRTSAAVPRESTGNNRDRGYFEFGRPEVLALIPASASSVLDIGCGGGRLGESLKRRQRAQVVGIELDTSAAESASTRLDEVLSVDVEQDSVEFTSGRFDCVVCADVLEHLRRPERLLAKIGRWLAEGGRLVASIPNIRHHSVITSLLAGNFTYEPAGLLDETHVRFFTRREIEKLFFRAGFRIEQMQSVAGPGDAEIIESARRGEVCAGGLRITGLRPADAAEFHAYQYLVVARPTRDRAAAPDTNAAMEQAWRRLAERHPWPAESPGVPVPERGLGWLGDGARAALERVVRSETRLIVELGTWLGESARAMSRMAPQARIVCVDHWKGSPEHQGRSEWESLLPRLYETFLTRCWDLRTRIVPLRMTTQEGLRHLAETGLEPEVVYVDAEHTTAAVAADLELARRLFPRARLVGDDYSAPEVAAAVEEHARRHGDSVVSHGTNWKGWELRCTTSVESSTSNDGLTSIVLVTHNQWEYTRLCLESIRFRTDEPYELIVVDNGSTDGTPDVLRASPDVRLIENADNRGFPAAANQGIAAARGERILLLNNDTVVTTGWLRRMLDAAESDDRIGLVGPVSNNVSGPQRIDVAYEQLADLDGFAWDWGKSELGRREDVERLVGFCLLIPRRVIETVGTLDERFGIGNFEDDDYCRRAVRAGFRCVIARDAFVHHFGGRTFLGSGVDYGRLLAENERKYRDKWSETGGPSPPRESEAREPSAAAPARTAGSNPAQESAPSAESKPIHLSLCMIVRDNERTIGPCLESIRPWVDEMIVVDTGSKDRTPEICRNLGAKVFHFLWCDDFSAARNESLKYAEGAWIFWMDSDDTIPAECGRRLRELVDQPHADRMLGYVMQVHCPAPHGNAEHDVTVVDHVKLFRNRHDLRFEHRIHEQVLPAIRRAGGDVAFTDIHVVHSGADHTPEGRARKLERDFRMLELDLRERPEHPFVLFNLGMTYADADRHGEAISHLRRCLGASQPGESHVRKCYALLVGALCRADRESEAWESCCEGRRLFPDDKELLFREAALHHASGRLNDAEQSYLRVLNGAGARHFTSADQGIGGFKARHNLARVYEDQGQFDQAEREWRTILSERPDYGSAWIGLAELLVSQRRLGDAADVARTIARRPSLQPEACLVRARLSDAAGDPLRARTELEGGLRGRPDNVPLLHELCRLLFERFDLREAEPHLRRLLVRSPADAAALHNLGTACLNLGKPDEAAEWYRRSLEHRPASAKTSLLLGKALQACGRAREAVEAWRAGMKAAPEATELREALNAIRPEPQAGGARE